MQVSRPERHAIFSYTIAEANITMGNIYNYEMGRDYDDKMPASKLRAIN